MILRALEYEFRCNHRAHPNWWAVTHVCRSWRNIALNEPTLWTDFTDPSLHPSWIREVFDRSQTAPLTLHVRLDGPFVNPVPFIFDHVVEHPERIKQLVIITGKTPFNASLFLKPAPYMESLSIFSTTSHGVEIPSDFLGGIAPRLQYLQCSDFKLPPEANWLAGLRRLECQRVHPEANYLSNLTELRLDSMSDSDTSMDTILSALENMPLLRLLHFPLSPYMDEAPCSRTTPVRVPHLSDITALVNGNPVMANIFDHLEVDNIIKLRIRWAVKFQDTALIEPVLRFFDRAFHGSDLCYLLRKESVVEVGRYGESTGGVYTPVLTLENFVQRDMESVMRLIPSCIPRVFETDHLSCSVQDTFALREWDSIEELRFRPYTQVETLFEVEDDNASPLPYPSLRRIQFQGVFRGRIWNVSVVYLLSVVGRIECCIDDVGAPGIDTSTSMCMPGKEPPGCSLFQTPYVCLQLVINLLANDSLLPRSSLERWISRLPSTLEQWPTVAILPQRNFFDRPDRLH
ncbi:hypothetical protein AB1N83_013241 [Pleurotus pulmonarius]